MTGADLILDPSMYPALPPTMHPTTNPTMTLIFFKNGEPKISVRIMAMNDKNPNPMNSGEPQLNKNKLISNYSVDDECRKRTEVVAEHR